MAVDIAESLHMINNKQCIASNKPKLMTKTDYRVWPVWKVLFNYSLGMDITGVANRRAIPWTSTLN